MTTVRTIKLKRSSQAYGDSAGSNNLSSPMAPEGEQPQENTAPAAPAPASDPSPAPEVTAPKTAPGKFTVVFMLIALFAVFGLLVILGLQNSEMSFYKAVPSVW